jgi:phasin family protein
MPTPETNPQFKAAFPKLADVTKKIAELKTPKLDINALMEAQRRNVEAITTLNQAIFDKMQSFAVRQAEVMRQGLEEASRLMNAIIAAPKMEEKVILQSEGSKIMMEKCMANACDAAETIGKCNSDAMETFSNRVSDGMKEFSAIMKTDLAA